MHPAGDSPSSNVGAGNSRPWYVHINPSARLAFNAAVGSKSLDVIPSGASTRSRIAFANGRPSTFSTTRPTTAVPAFEYLVVVPGWYTNGRSFRLATVFSSEGGPASK